MTAPAAAPVRRAGATLATLAALAGATTVLVVAGGSLPFPGDLHPTRLATWADEVGGPTAAFTALRALALALLAWCTAGWALGVVARRTRRPAAVRVTDRLSLPVVRRLADAAAGLAVVGATLVPAAAGAAPAPTIPPASVVTMADIGPSFSPGTTTTTTEAPTSAPSAAPGAPGRPSGSSTPPLGEAAPTPGEVAAETPADPHGASWIIGPGDTLWHVAEETLIAELGRAPSGAEVVERLHRIVALNLERLAVPGDPGLVFPGQEFLLP